jgi:hypothetical protein
MRFIKQIDGRQQTLHKGLTGRFRLDYTRETAWARQQGNLFEENPYPRQAVLDQTMDTIRSQFGAASIKGGSFMDKSTELD